MINKENSLGCGIKNNDFICGVADAWGHERLCKRCKAKLILKWDKEDKKRINAVKVNTLDNYSQNNGEEKDV